MQTYKAGLNMEVVNYDLPDYRIVDIDKLKPYVNNSRTHSEAQIKQVKESIKKFRFLAPLVIGKKEGLLAGHCRLIAALELGFKQLPVISAEHLTEDEKAAYVIADNQLPMNAGWDEGMLKVEISRLDDNDFDLSVLGFEDDFLNGLLAVEKDFLKDPDEVPEPPKKPTTVLGDIWKLGDHRLMCGDSTSIDAVDELMDGAKADMVFTDPPWNVNYGAEETPKYKQGRKIINDNLGDEEWREFCKGFAATLYISTKSGGLIYCVMSAQEWAIVDSALRDAGFHWSSSIIWAKDSLVLSRKDYHTQYEPIWYGWNSNAPRVKKMEDRKQSDLWKIDRPKKSPLHPTTKPIELIQRAIENSSKGEDVVLDLFGGSGSTLIACEKTRRHSRLMELDPIYCDVIIRRWEEFTGEKAINTKTNEGYVAL
jgi:DNA modification methylase